MTQIENLGRPGITIHGAFVEHFVKHSQLIATVDHQ